MGFDAIAAQWAVANGIDTRATGTGAVALGFGSIASGSNTVAIGAAGGDGTTPLSAADSTTASQQGSIAIGANDVRGAQSTAANAIALGGESTAQATDALAVGRASSANSANAVALGAGAIVSDAGAVALGSGSATAAALGTASGTIAGTTYAYAGTTPTSTVSIGGAATERTLTNLAAGRVSTTSTDAVNGSQLNATNVAVTAVDGAVDVLGAGVASSLGGGSTYDPATGTLSAPSYQIGSTTYNNVGGALGAVNTTLNAINAGGGVKYFHANSTQADSVASGANSIAVGPQTVASGGSSIAIGLGSAASQDRGIAIGQDSSASSTGTVAIGTRATASATGAIAIGTEGTFGATAVASGPDTLAIGNGSQASGGGSAAFGAAAVSAGNRSLSAGPNASAAGANAVAVGDRASAVSSNSTALGRNSVAGATGVDGATALGATASATGANSLALGIGANAAQGGAIALGAASVTAAAVATASGTVAGTTYTYAGTAPTSTVSIGSVAAERTLTNVAAGRVSTTSTDGINGSQLNATNLAVTAVDSAVDTLGSGVASSLGGGSTYDPATGTLAPPSYSVGGTTVNNVGAALTNIDGRTSSNTTAIANLGDQINSGSIGLLQQDAITRNLTAGAATDGTTVDFTGTAGTRVLTGVGLGAITATSADAINGSQLFAGNTSIAAALGGGAAVNPDGTLSAPTYTINGTDYGNVGDALAHLATGGVQPRYFHANSLLADSTAQGTDSIAVGPVADALATDAVAIGRSATAGAAAGGAAAVALGADASATGAGGLALGQGANSSQDGAVALGSGAQTAVAIGTSSITIAGQSFSFAGAAPVSTVSIGAVGAERTLTNVAAGRISAASTDAVNGSQLYATNQSVENLASVVSGINTGGGIRYFRANASGPDAVAGGIDSVAIGAAALASGNAGLAIGQGAQASHDNSVALGAGAQTTTGAQASYSAAYVGASSSTGEVNVGSRTISGVAAGAAPTDAVNVSQLDAGVQSAISVANAYTESRLSQVAPGPGSAMFSVNSASPSGPSTVGADSVAGGAGAVASGSGSVAIGNSATATGAASMALGNGASVTADNSVAIGAGSVAGRGNAFSVGDAGAERTVINMAAGSADTDAVNVAQLRQAQASGTQYATAPDGTPDYANLSLGGPNGTTTTRVHNVSAGVAPTDAVNVQQLQAGLDDNLLQSRQYTDMRLQDVEGDMRTMRDEMRGGTASAMAMAGMPQATIPGGNMLAVGMGGYQGEVAMAVGLSTMTDDGQYILKANVSTNTERDFGFSVGAGYQW